MVAALSSTPPWDVLLSVPTGLAAHNLAPLMRRGS